MSEVAHIHKSKQGRRPHFIPQWAEHRGYALQADFIRALIDAGFEVDKSLVSRWYNGTSPGEDWQERLASFFGCEKESLFRHPDDDWLVRFFKNRSQDEVRRMKGMLEAAFPERSKAS